MIYLSDLQDPPDPYGDPYGEEVNIGFVGDGVLFSVKTDVVNLTGAQTGNVAQDKIVIGGEVKVMIPFKEISIENFQRGVPSARIIQGGGKTRVDFVVAGEGDGESDRFQRRRRVRLVEDTHHDLLSELCRECGNAEIDTALLDHCRETSVLRLPLFIKTEFRKNLDARDDGFVHFRRQFKRRVQIAVHAEANACLGGRRFYMNVRRVSVYGVAQYCGDDLRDRSIFFKRPGGSGEVECFLAELRRFIDLRKRFFFRCLLSRWLLGRFIFVKRSANLSGKILIRIYHAVKIFFRDEEYLVRYAYLPRDALQCIERFYVVGVSNADLKRSLNDIERDEPVMAS